MSDYTVFVKGRGTAYLGGPPLVKMAIDEIVDEETLGGAEMHSRTSGLSDYLAADELDGAPHRPPDRPSPPLEAARSRRPPNRRTTRCYDPAELLGCASADVRIPFDIREVLARLLDGSRFEEFKPLFGDKLVCGWGSICGFPVGVLGNNGILFSEEAKKGSQFIQLCNRTNTPLLFLHNITGFMVGSKAEQGGIIVNGAKMINAVSNSTVPHFNLMVGASYGAGNYGMAGKAYNPRLIFSWPNHRIAVMGPKQLAGVMEIVARNAAAGRGIEVDEDAILAQTAALEAQIEHESTALYSTGRVWDDGIIHPADSRTVMGIALAAAHSNAIVGRHRVRRVEALMVIERLLIANRGEIAVRIARTASRLGIETVGVYSEPDTNALHVDSVDVAVALGGSTPTESYLRGDAIIAAALAHRMPTPSIPGTGSSPRMPSSRRR